MPRLPVIDRRGLRIGVLLATLLAAPPVTAQVIVPKQPSTDTLMYHMLKDHDAGEARRLYASSVSTAMLYSQCPAEYHVDDAKRTRMDQVLYRDELAFRAALKVAHQRLMYKLPSDETLKAVDAYIAKFRNDEAVKLGTIIKNNRHRCDQAMLRGLDKAYEKRIQVEAYEAAQAKAAAEKSRLIDPVEINETQQ